MLNDDLSIRRISYLCEAVGQGSVRGAADRLDINASAVSRQITLLEDELGTKLLERHNRGVKPTEVGSLLIDYYRSHEMMRRDLLDKLQEVKGLQRGNVAISLGAGFVSDLLGGPLTTFHAQHLGIAFSLDTAGTNEVITNVIQDAAHIGLVYNPGTNAEIRSRASAVKPLCAIVSPRHPLANLEKVSLQHIAGFPVVLKEISFGTMQLVSLAATSEKVQLRPVLVTNDSTVMFDFVRNSEAIAFGPAFAVNQQVTDGTLRAVPIAHQMLQSAEAHLITRQGRSLPHAAHRLVQHLASTMEAFRAE